MNHPLEYEQVSEAVRERLQSPNLQGQFGYAEADDVAYYQFALQPLKLKPVEGITLGPQVTSRIFERVFWIAPKKGVLNKPEDMEALLDEVSDGFYTEHITARVRDGRLIYGRREFWTGPWQRCLNIELVALPHRTVLEMLQNYFSNKENVHPVLRFEDRAGLAYSASQEQLRMLQEHERELSKLATRSLIGTRGIEAVGRWLADRTRFLRGSN